MTYENKKYIENSTNESSETSTEFISQFALSTHILKKSAKNLGLTAVQKSILSTMSVAAPISRMSVKTISERSGYGITSVKLTINELLRRDILVFNIDSKRNVACQYLFNLEALGYSAHTQLKCSFHTNLKQRLELQIARREQIAPVKEVRIITARERKDRSIAMALDDIQGLKVAVKKDAPMTFENCHSSAILTELD